MPRFLAVLSAALLTASSASAADYNTTSLQGLFGTQFDDVATGNATRDGRMFTLTLDNSLGWRYGDHYLFVDLTSGRFGDGATRGYSLYAEWQPRLSLSKIIGTRIAVGPIDDVLVAAGLERGPRFSAVLGGIGVDLKVPGFAFWTLNAYVRDDNYNQPNYQVTTAWSLPFRIAGVGFAFDGFIDVYGSDATPGNVLAQPQLLLDVGALVGLDERALQLGAEWWLHRTAGHFTSSPQAMVKWTF
jgi:nucleoside-specific outer membrane channel protein Tsx